jgi:hypothetical protein
MISSALRALPFPVRRRMIGINGLNQPFKSEKKVFQLYDFGFIDQQSPL